MIAFFGGGVTFGWWSGPDGVLWAAGRFDYDGPHYYLRAWRLGVAVSPWDLSWWPVVGTRRPRRPGRT